MRSAHQTVVRRAISGSLIVGGCVAELLGLVLLFGDFTAMGPEDEVPLAMWLAPLLVGAAAIAVGIGIRATTERGLSGLLKPGEYLVCYDMPRMSGLWGVLIAPSAEAIHATYPELAIAHSLPEWMGEDEVARMRETPLWLDEEPPQGLLLALVADRHRE